MSENTTFEIHERARVEILSTGSDSELHVSIQILVSSKRWAEVETFVIAVDPDKARDLTNDARDLANTFRQVVAAG